jgi:hypothetical protein
MSSPQYLTPKQVAARLNVNTECLRYWRRRGTGPPWVRLGPKTIRYPAPDLEMWIVNVEGQQESKVEMGRRS